MVGFMNDLALAQGARAGIAAALGADAVVPLLERATTSDDFAWMVRRLPGLYLKIGCSEPDQELVPLHNRGFRFAPEAIRYGVAALSAAILERLQAG